MSVLSTTELERRISNLEAENRELRQKATASGPNALSDLQKDAANLLFALHDAWPYVHGHCTIDSVKQRIISLIRKHGDFYDLNKPATNELDDLIGLLKRVSQESSRLPTNLDDEIHETLKKYRSRA